MIFYILLHLIVFIIFSFLVRKFWELRKLKSIFYFYIESIILLINELKIHEKLNIENLQERLNKVSYYGISLIYSVLKLLVPYIGYLIFLNLLNKNLNPFLITLIAGIPYLSLILKPNAKL